ncbi:MAG: hypothetical protein WDN49_24155 [Acetobacteraceae bacterium]
MSLPQQASNGFTRSNVSGSVADHDAQRAFFGCMACAGDRRVSVMHALAGEVLRELAREIDRRGAAINDSLSRLAQIEQPAAAPA